MISRLLGAFLRAILVILVIALPGLLIPGVSSEGVQFLVLIGIFAGGFVLFEYAAATPILIEFRDAPPFNRIRFLAFATVIGLVTIVFRAAYLDLAAADAVLNLGTILGQMLDFPYSPVRLAVLMLPPTATAETVEIMRAGAALGYLVGIISILSFLFCLRNLGWPGRRGQFNVLINLPLFDPTAGGDVLERLARSARINVILGIVLPFIIPVCVRAAGQLIDPINFGNSLTLVWVIAIWAWLPAALFLRGIAMARLVLLIEDQRRIRYAEAAEEGLYA